jgi:hypothetical protein
LRLDPAARFVTGVFWVLVVGVWVGSGSLLNGGQTGLALVMGAVAIAFAALAIWCRLLQPMAYEVQPDRLSIVRRRGAVHLPGRPRDAEVRPFGPSDLRILGTGGLYGYTGRFRLAGIGWVWSYVTDGRAGVLLRVGDRPVLVAPADRDGFIEAVGGVDA